MSPRFEIRPDLTTCRSPEARVLLAAFLLDLVAGDPPDPWHPVAWFGKAARFLEERAPQSKAGRLAFGAAAAIGLPCVYAFLGWLLLRCLPSGWRWLLEAALLKSAFAVRGLLAASEQARVALQRDDLAAAHQALRSLVSRNVSQLDRRLTASAAVESLAENTVDSFIAPWLFYTAGGLPAALAYRALNTLDAMWGYREARYEELGKAAARLDDVANYIPATISARLILLAGRLMGLSAADGARILKRDGGTTASPNAGRPMSAMAGVLGVQLERRGSYLLGDDARPLGHESIASAQRVTRLTAFLSLALALVSLLLRRRIWQK